jgi:hypothetical protein
MADKKDLTRPPTPAGSPASMVDSFLAQAKRLGPMASNAPRARLVFALDATMSRQPTWDLACRVQGEMFAAASDAGGPLGATGLLPRLRRVPLLPLGC